MVIKKTFIYDKYFIFFIAKKSIIFVVQIKIKNFKKKICKITTDVKHT